MDKPKILVAEDEGIIAKDLEHTLKGMGYAVSGTASSGEEAIRKALETRPDLILMDIVLRGDMDGVAAAEEIRSRLEIPVVFLTAHADEKTLQRAKISGPFGYLLKPFEERGLRGTIEVALHIHAMEKKLKKSAEEWRSTFDSIQDWVSIHDCEFRIVRTNRAMAEAFRRAPQDMIGKTCYEVFHRGNEPIPQCPHIRALETRRPCREELFEPHLGIHVELSVSPIFDEKGGLTGTVHVAKDISERKRAQEALRESEERYRRLFEGVPLGLYRSTPEGKLLDANPALARLFGYADTDSLSRLEMTDTYVDPRDRQGFKALMEEKGRVEQFRTERRRRDGSRFWSESQSIAVRGPDGAIQCYEGSVQDVSDRRAFEEELRRSERHARQLAFEKSILAEIGRIISSTTDVEEVYKAFAGEAKKLLSFDRLIVSLVDRGKRTMANRFVDGASVPGRNVGEVFPFRGSFGEAVIESRRGILLHVENEEETVSRFPGLLLDIRAGLKSVLSVPLFYRDAAVGALHIFSANSKAYKEEDLPTARSIADQIAGAVVNANLFNALKKVSESLAESEERYRAIMESAGRAGGGVIILQDLGEREGACIFANEQAGKITGYTEEELLQASWMEIVHPSSLPSVRDRYRRRMSGEDMPGFYEISFRHKTGREVPVEVIATRAQIQGKTVLVAFFRDITARKDLERQLAQA
jgi:PAS domain S-box-containing protein